ncbi:unnamed protein product [Rotaria socialis]|uniref:Uncharacterized protein n=1 Tax=Rotaria socialis TaxID=392032 RepID=A0A818ICC9_9BILA|nr:unnamed protein product [Rotaria socialis]CAF4769846.1 unnamed protein product [Rotaria socialis]
MTVESQRDIQDQPYVNNDDDRDIAICQRRPLNEYQQVHNRKFTDAVSKLVNHMDSHHEKVEKQLKMFSKTIQRTTVASGLDQFRRDGEIFPDVVVIDVIAFKKNITASHVLSHLTIKIDWILMIVGVLVNSPEVF